MPLDPSFATPERYLLERPIRRVVRELGAPLFFLDPADTKASAELDLLENGVASFCALAGPRARTSFFFLATLVSWATRIRAGGSRNLAKRAAALVEVEHGKLAAPFHGVKALLCIVYFENTEVIARLGLATSCLHEAKP